MDRLHLGARGAAIVDRRALGDGRVCVYCSELENCQKPSSSPSTTFAVIVLFSCSNNREMLSRPRMLPFPAFDVNNAQLQHSTRLWLQDSERTTTEYSPYVESVPEYDVASLTRSTSMCTELLEDIMNDMTANELTDAINEASRSLMNIRPPELNRRSTSDSSWDFVSPRC